VLWLSSLVVSIGGVKGEDDECGEELLLSSAAPPHSSGCNCCNHIPGAEELWGWA
jgi:hypothetical protein